MGRLTIILVLLARQVPFIQAFSAYLLQRARRQMGSAVGWLDYLTQQLHEAQPEDLDLLLTQIAATGQQQLVIRIESGAYQITEQEFYYHGRQYTNPYLHQGDEQLKRLHWHFNQATSLGLTFGNRETTSYGGILLRGLLAISSPLPKEFQATHPCHIGPQVLNRARVASWGSAIRAGTSRLHLEESPVPGTSSRPASRKARVGLS
jgi:hypothetical protein